MSKHTQTQKQIADPNAVRAETEPAAAGPRRICRLKLARAARVVDAACTIQRARLGNWSDGGRLCQRRSINQQRLREEMRMIQHLEELLRSFGYKVVDDAWDSEGRKTFLCSEDADKTFIRDLERSLAEHGWKKHKTQLRAFRNPNTGEVLEVEVGGPDTSGNFVHLLKSE